jgi:hypothetical protein
VSWTVRLSVTTVLLRGLSSLGERVLVYGSKDSGHRIQGLVGIQMAQFCPKYWWGLPGVECKFMTQVAALVTVQEITAADIQPEKNRHNLSRSSD